MAQGKPIFLDFAPSSRFDLVLTDTVEARPSLVANFYESCSLFYSDLLAALAQASSVDYSILVSLQRSQNYLVLWADGFDAVEAALDASLSNSKRIRNTTLRLLLGISKTLMKSERTDQGDFESGDVLNRIGLFLYVTEDQQSLLNSRATEFAHITAQLKDLIHQDDSIRLESELDSDASSDGGDSDLGEIAADLRTDTQCLLDLGSRFREPAVGPVANESAAKLEDGISWNPEQSFIERIPQRYPRCEAALAERLGKASWLRVLHCQELKTENTKLPQQKAATHTDTAATKPASTTFHDSGLGSSVPSGPDYAETVVSYEGGQGGTIRVPPLPEGAKDGIPFDCVGCGSMVTAKTKSKWKTHLFRGLRPYLCLENTCTYNQTSFLTRSQWANHLSLEHEATIYIGGIDCSICMEKLPGSLAQVTTHLARHLEEIALTVLPTSVESKEVTDATPSSSSADSSDYRHPIEHGAEEVLGVKMETQVDHHGQ
ncbi:uncharacterized protein PG986_014824 [Apiospora aurea]|uniref:C2H2-type domain-containing protein n=1 Tax=Apiospora aurea TaxID=335848 RepID=A0ABR1PU29_9PEZI